MPITHVEEDGMNKAQSLHGVRKTWHQSFPLSIEVKIPTASDMADFASQFSEEEWVRLCREKTFLAKVTYNLIEASVIASSILSRKIVHHVNLLHV
jgi:hypothetical protein